MAGNSVIGALRVDLGLNSAQFTAGLKKAEGGLAAFGRAAGVGLAAVAAAATTAAIGLGAAVKHSIDAADAMGKMAQKVGVGVESLSRLNYAATYADVSLDQLGGSLQKLSKSMIDASKNAKGGPAAAFAALGIKVKDAAGNLRSSDDVFKDIADRFSKLPDGATKTAIAIQLLGKSGAELIPLLNSGADGLKRMADESDNLHQTITGSTAAAANEFNDSLTKVGKTLAGIPNLIIADGGVQDALKGIAETLASPSFAEAATVLAKNVIGGLDSIVRAVAATLNWIDELKRRASDSRPFLKRLRHDRPNSLPGLSSNIEDQTEPNFLSDPNLMDHGAAGDLLINGTFGALGGANTFGSVRDMFTSLRGPNFDLSKFTDPAVNALKPLDLGLETTTEHVKTLGETIADELSDPLANLTVDLLTGKNALQDLANTALDFGKQLLSSGFKALLNLALGGIGGGFGAPSAVGYGFGSYGSFDGGGYTGMSSRSGGMDGKGGFLAMLHPDETVLDHTRGQGAGTVNNYISGSKADAAAIANEVTKQLKQQFPVMSAAYARNPHRKG